MKTIAVIADQPQRFLDQIILVKGLMKYRDIVVYFIFPNKYYDSLDFKEYTGIFIPVRFNKKDKSKSEPLRKKKTWLLPHLLRRFLENTSLYQTRATKNICKTFYQDYTRAKEIISELKPDVIIANGDRHKGIELPILKALKDTNIDVVIPYLSYVGDGLYLRNKSRDLYKPNLFSSIFFFYTYYKYRKKNRNKLMYFTPYYVHAFEKKCVFPENPWIIGTGLSDVVCVDNKNTYSRYLNEGVPERKLRIVGDISYDKLYDCYCNRVAMKNVAKEKYNLDDRKKYIICALPQLAEHMILDWDEHWEEIDFLVETLSSQNQNLLLSLHPKMDRQKYTYLEEKYGCKILDERLFDLLPIADMFVATFSSTVVWAVLCGIKSIVIDFYGFNYDMYNFLKSIDVVHEKKRLYDAVLNKLNEDIDFGSDWDSLSRDKVFDGNTIPRYISLIEELVDVSK